MPVSLPRSRGCLLGLAIGDALGAPVEFCRPGSFEPVTGYRPGGAFDLEAGQWTDDSSMALCLGDSLLVTGELDLADQLERYWRWFEQGENSVTGRCFDIGVGTRDALLRWRRTGCVEAGGDESAGNGALMRMAPIAICWQHDPAQAGWMASRSAVTTHGHPLAIAAAGYFGELLARCLGGESKEGLLSDWWRGPEPLQQIAHGSWRVATIRASGHAPRSLEAALWAFGSTASFQDCVLAAANLGDDSDTVAAMAGQLAGAHYGFHAIPQSLVCGLQQAHRFLEMAERLAELAAQAEGGIRRSDRL